MRGVQARFVLFVVCLISFVGFSHAKFKGPDETPQYHTVSDVLTHPVDGEEVKLRGRITARIGQSKYLFIDADSTGEIPVTISDIITMLHKDFGPQDTITISAKITMKVSWPELIASSLDIA